MKLLFKNKERAGRVKLVVIDVARAEEYFSEGILIGISGWASDLFEVEAMVGCSS